MSTFKNLIYFISFLFILPSCKKQAAVVQQSHTTSDSGNKEDHKYSKDESIAASEAVMKFVESRQDLTIYNRMLKNSSSVIPMLYDDKRLKVSYFIPVDKAFETLSGDRRKKLEDQVPDDFELQMLSRGIVKATDFSWAGATSLSGEKFSFSSDMKSVQIGNTSAQIIEIQTLGNQTRIYLMDGLLIQ
ncbi:MAG: fasciclin domain-containing protein [Saprospiraceae bacterium]|nr:hypothetical protein [Candidatus Vicinibacter proximus]MCC6844672.1 hypothetical protein [Saprospiraceae bacterium]